MPEETAGPTPTDTGQPTPTLAADTATATTARPTAMVEVPAPVDQRIQFAPGATSTTLDGSLLAGQSHSFIFGALGGQTARVEVESSGGSANFSLIGLDDGQPYKRIVNEDRTWEGILPRTQEYMLTVVSADEAADYELLVGLVPAPPFTVIYDAHTDALLGGFKDALWVDASTAAEALFGGEQYGIFHLGQQLVQAIGSASLDIGGICPGQTVQLTPRPAQTNALAVAGAPRDVALRLVAPVELSQAERQAVTDLLVGKGLAISASELQVDGALGTDLDGIGTGEIIVQASRLKDDGRFPAEAPHSFICYNA